MTTPPPMGALSDDAAMPMAPVIGIVIGALNSIVCGSNTTHLSLSSVSPLLLPMMKARPLALAIFRPPLMW